MKWYEIVDVLVLEVGASGILPPSQLFSQRPLLLGELDWTIIKCAGLNLCGLVDVAFQTEHQ